MNSEGILSDDSSEQLRNQRIEEAQFNLFIGKKKEKMTQLSLDFMQAACFNSRSSILEILNETSYWAFKKYLTSKC